MRAAAIILEQNRLALIKRQREGMTYYLFPGGAVEDGETPEEAVIREVKEELGLVVGIKQLLAKVHFNQNVQLYYLANIQGGTFGTGDGEEYSDQKDPNDGSYHPVWLQLDELTESVRPTEVVKLIRSRGSGWPTSVQEFYETSA
jgi:8-oxo-dGTP diphosphatase